MHFWLGKDKGTKGIESVTSALHIVIWTVGRQMEKLGVRGRWISEF